MISLASKTKLNVQNEKNVSDMTLIGPQCKKLRQLECLFANCCSNDQTWQLEFAKTSSQTYTFHMKVPLHIIMFPIKMQPMSSAKKERG